MTYPHALFERLGLRPDCDEKDLRRAYARELKKIDQETQAELFQELRETYEQLTGWLRHQREQTEPAPPSTVAPPEADHTAVAKPSESLDPAADPQQTSSTSSESLGREVLERVILRLTNHPFVSREDAAGFLATCMDDPRLVNLDARHYFEWGIASILANGWRGGHELLFAPAIDYFGWRDDRANLLRLGRPGYVVDAAISELAAFDAQAPADRELQRDVIRALRKGEKPSTSNLLKALPVAEFVVSAFPNWVYLISDPNHLTTWRNWHAEVPDWRKTQLLRPTLKPVVAASTPARSSSTSSYLILFAVLAMLLMLFRMMDTPPRPVRLSLAAANAPALQKPPTEGGLLFVPRTQPNDAPINTSPTPDIDPVQARKKALILAKGKANQQLCNDVSALAQDNPSTHQKGEFGERFDRLVLDCLVKKWGNTPYGAIDASLKREQARTKRELANLLNPDLNGMNYQNRPINTAPDYPPWTVKPKPVPPWEVTAQPDKPKTKATESSGLGFKNNAPSATADSESPPSR